ncbi:putative porin [Thalassomonas actiniarum]|uniref:Porin n=1 Tax=Thalassomonas actiniarum TaxID=485447 RepID=A0AAE9YNP3_9GAMM|nr:putative porin [Thalassomonas actiniarum]WDD98011.1 putative porin [Thalassomonas actiniarum]
MKLLPIAALLLTGTSLLASTGVHAEDYQSFSSVSYSDLDTKYNDSDAFSLDTRYYFDKKSTLGPLDEFEYINKTSNVFGSFVDTDFNKTFTLGGEAFIDKLLVGATYHYSDFDHGGSDDTYSLSLGYLISDDFLVKVVKDDNNDEYLFSASYNHQINDSDYIGFTYSTDDDTDVQTLSSKYFTDLGQGRYLTAEVSFSDIDDADNDLAGRVEYFFNSHTSMAASYNDDDDYSVGAKHYFNKNYALGASYQSNTDSDIDYDLYTIDFTAQF